MDIKEVELGSRVKMEAVGTVIHLHSNGRADIQWDNSSSENSVDVSLLELEDEE